MINVDKMQNSNNMYIRYRKATALEVLDSLLSISSMAAVLQYLHYWVVMSLIQVLVKHLAIIGFIFVSLDTVMGTLVLDVFVILKGYITWLW